jgi:glutathione S-transferase
MADSDISARRVLYGVGTMRTLRAHWVLAELGLAYTTKPILPRTGETQTSAYRCLNPLGKIPLLQDGDLTVTESPAIVAYIGERYGTDACRLVPKDLGARTGYNEWVSFITMELDATSLYVLRRHEGLPHVYGPAPVATVAARNYFLRQINAAAEDMADSRPHLVADTFTGADLLMTTCLIWAARLDLPLPGVFEAYYQRHTARPAFQTALAANTPPET